MHIFNNNKKIACGVYYNMQAIFRGTQNSFTNALATDTKRIDP